MYTFIFTKKDDILQMTLPCTEGLHSIYLSSASVVILQEKTCLNGH